jgi:hypothetical protein
VGLAVGPITITTTTTVPLRSAQAPLTTTPLRNWFPLHGHQGRPLSAFPQWANHDSAVGIYQTFYLQLLPAFRQ